MDLSRDAQDWSNYWQGRSGQAAGAALTGSGAGGAGVETDAELARFWAGVFQDAPKSARVLDLACGAGSALRAAAAAGLEDLIGLDVSPGALAALKAAVPGARAVEASAADTGLAAASFDLVVSQFGFEYAGAVPAAQEAARLMAPGARFTAIAHLKGGAIEAECAAKLKGAEAIMGSGFIEAAETVFGAAFAGDETAYKSAAQALQAPRAELSRLAVREGLAKHLLDGAAQLFARRDAYALGDITGWLCGMRAEIEAYAGRMRSMTRAALTEPGAAAALAAMPGCTPSAPQALTLDGRPAAWILRSEKN